MARSSGRRRGGEQSEHITVFSGACGHETSAAYRTAYRAWEADARAALGRGEVYAVQAPVAPPAHHLVDKVIALMHEIGAAFELTDTQYDVLNTLSLDTWDSSDFFLLPVAVIFPRKGGPDPAWARYAVSEKMRVYTTDDGWMDDVTKLKHYNCYGEFPHSPYRSTVRHVIEQRDGHWSNETIAQSEAYVRDNNTGLRTPGHHTAVLQGGDQRGGPNQHSNRIAKLLLRRQWRIAGRCEPAHTVRIIEIAVAASHNPKIYSYAQCKVGWTEDASGNLAYDPLATCDKSVLTATQP